MNDRNKIFKILEYWKWIDFLEQKNYYDLLQNFENVENKKLKNDKQNLFYKTFKLEDLKEGNIAERIHNVLVKQVEQYNQKGEYHWDSLTVYFGKVLRDDCIEELIKLIKTKDIKDKAILDSNAKDYIPAISFQLENNLEYKENTFSVSPILWSIHLLKEKRKLVDDLTSEKYKIDNNKLANDFFKTKTNGKILDNKIENANNNPTNSIYSIDNDEINYINNLLNKIIENGKIEQELILCFKVIKNNKNKEPDEKLENDSDNDDMLTDLSNSFFVSDINMVNQYLQNNSDENIEKYILANTIKTENSRIDLLKYEESSIKLTQILSPENYPLGKWFSEYSLALMQQMAINLITNQNNNINNLSSIFSVNGPPGTGKTTLLKEIIVDNIIKKAIIFSNLQNPDNIFEWKSLDDNVNRRGWWKITNEDIMKYGVVVASCNNAAVENISKELPKMNEFIKKHFPKNNDKYFAINYQNSNTDNKRQSNINNDEIWGLISASLGKQKNIKEFINNYLKPINDDLAEKKLTVEQKIRNFHESQKKFLEKLKNVEDAREELITLSSKFIENKNQRELVDRQLKKINEYKNSKQEIDNLNKTKKIGLRKFANLLIVISFLLLVGICLISYLIENKGIIRDFNNKHNKFKQCETDILNIAKSLGIYDLEDLKKVLKYKAKKLFEENERLKKYVEKKDIIPFNAEYIDNLNNSDKSTKAHIQNPWFNKNINEKRMELFKAAINLTKSFIYGSKAIQKNLKVIKGILNNDTPEYGGYKLEEKEKIFKDAFATLQILVPVISTTFASVHRMFKYIDKKPKSLGTVIIDEAGQAQPHMALGLIFRSTKTIIVGDPKQVEPVVTDDLDLLKEQIFKQDFLETYIDKKISVQSLADKINSYGTKINKEWVGCPLLVHRRCLKTMFEISNQISYGGIMKIQTINPKEEDKQNFLKLKESTHEAYWVNIKGEEKSSKNHYVEEQGEEICKILEKYDFPNLIPNLYIISPFKSVENGLNKKIEDYFKFENNELKKNIVKFCRNNLGTVHKFQGKEANEVIFILGCSESTNNFAITNFVKSNIVNVAVTRARYRLYIVGDYRIWKNNEHLKKAYDIIREKGKETIVNKLPYSID